MLKVVLQYENYLQDTKIVFGILAAHGVEIVNTKRITSDNPKITIYVKNHEKLCSLLYDLNDKSNYGVVVVKVRRRDDW